MMLFALAICETYAQKEEFQTVKIGNQVWMAKNLDVITFRNGDLIPEAKSREEWSYYDSKNLPAFCYYNNDKKTKSKYGVIYNRHVFDDPRSISPSGWRVANRNDWNTLKGYVGGKDGGRKLMSKSGWFRNFNGNNSTGFNAPAAGAREYDRFRNNYETYFFVSGTICDYFSLNANGMIEDNGSWCVGMYIRCIKDDNPVTVDEIKQVNVQYSEETKGLFRNKLGEYKYGGIIYDLWKDKNGFEKGYVVSKIDLTNRSVYTNVDKAVGMNARSRSNGKRNTIAIMKQTGHNQSVAKLCSEYKEGGYDDWFLPAINDLIQIGNNLKFINSSLWTVKDSRPIAEYVYQYWTSTESKTGEPMSYDFYYKEEHDNAGRIGINDISVRAIRLFTEGEELNNKNISTNSNIGKNPIKHQDEVVIGNQTWTSKNLDVEFFRNGDQIFKVKNKMEWSQAIDEKKPAWCYYNYDESNANKYGKLYNWYAVNDSRGLAPNGYHIPTNEEWTILEDYLGKLCGDKMKSTTGWAVGANGDNSSGFNGLPGGHCNNAGNFENDLGQYGYWWSATEDDGYDAWARSLSYNTSRMSKLDDFKGSGFSVRCLRD
jgi:uncharacterized protein (TIGR02145 family)